MEPVGVVRHLEKWVSALMSSPCAAGEDKQVQKLAQCTWNRQGRSRKLRQGKERVIQAKEEEQEPGRKRDGPHCRILLLDSEI